MQTSQQYFYLDQNQLLLLVFESIIYLSSNAILVTHSVIK